MIPRIGRPSRRLTLLLLLLGLPVLALLAGPAVAQDITVGFGADSSLTERAVQLVALLTVLSLAPSILVMVTSFTRIVVVLSLLRSAIGLQTAPPNMVMVSLALFLSAFIMAPTLQTAYNEGVEPLVNGDIEFNQAFERGSAPFRTFMLSQVREQDLSLFQELSGQPAPQTPDDLAMSTLIPAFMISELRRAFEIGFLLYLPFLIIDLVIASVLMSMGMMMLPPVVISLPFKLIFFVLVDGWNLVAGSLVKSFGAG
ncbi:flagellar type III secretion system pore protein FliP [uncultured Roseibium sp.]|uniref:flagellar type III secretion system pore protein FliP n=1 Tax=uncultured Roseibium sp. TaxID=1936171 RepID=UPI003216BF35